MKESTIEKKVCKYAESEGWLTYKFVSPGNKGVPDRIFLKDEICFFIEFKAPGKKLTKLQEFVQQTIRDQDFSSWEVDDVDKGKLIIDNYRRIEITNRH